jgi:hypothetical protein
MGVLIFVVVVGILIVLIVNNKMGYERHKENVQW